MLQIQSHQQQRGAQGASNTTGWTVTTLQTERIKVVMNVSINRMEAQPVVTNIDQNLLVELSNQFPSIPHQVIISLIQKNQNNRERCMWALRQESQNCIGNNALTSHTPFFRNLNDNGICHINTAIGGTGAFTHPPYAEFQNQDPSVATTRTDNIYTQSVSTLPAVNYQYSTSINRTQPSPASATCTSPANSRQLETALGQYKPIYPPMHQSLDNKELSGSPGRAPHINTSTGSQVCKCDVPSPGGPQNQWLEYYQQPPQFTATSSGVTYVSQVNKFISPQEDRIAAVRPPPKTSINITFQRPPYNMNSIGMALPTDQPALPGTSAASAVYGMQNMTTSSWQNAGSPVIQNTPHQLPGMCPQMAPVGMAMDQNPASITGLVHRQGSEDTSYIQSLVLHQNSKLKKLQEDFKAAFEYCEKLKREVAIKEKQMVERRKSRSGLSISMTDLQKVQDENRTLQVDSHLLTLEFDRITKGEPIIGQDPNESFYARIPGGQQGLLPHTDNKDRGSSFLPASSKATTVSEQPPSHPPAPPAMVLPPNEQNRSLQHVREVEEENWNCSACTFSNHPELHSCEMCNMPRLAHR